MDGEVIRSMEGTTQGDPLAMAMYGLATVPLIRKLDGTCRHIWYADDSAAWGSLDQLRSWWSQLSRIGPGFGYFANPQRHGLWSRRANLKTQPPPSLARASILLAVGDPTLVLP